MGDPFWRRFSTGKDRSFQHSKERTLASEYANLNTRQGPSTVTAPGGQSRNDLFSKDWKWKGTGEEQQATGMTSRHGGPLRLGLNEANEKISNPNPKNTELPIQTVVSNALADSSVPVTPARAVAKSILGEPFQLKSPSNSNTATQVTSPGTTRRSRNDTIYNVNHLTITPPGKLKATDNIIVTHTSPQASFEYSSTRHPLDRPTETLQCERTSLHQPSSHANHSGVTGPSRSTSLDSTSSCGDSAITSFTEQANDEPLPSRLRETRQGESDGGFTQSPISPVRSPTTPVTPDTTHIAGFSSFTQSSDGKGHAKLTSGQSGWLYGTGASPQHDVSLSRSSSLTIVQSSSRALSNIRRRAQVLLSESANTGDGEESPCASDEHQLHVRGDIHSRSWLIGYGRYAKVFLGSYHAATTGWTLCAAKVFDADAESVDMARKEDAMLRYLHEGGNTALVDGRPYILDTIALVDDSRLESVPAMAIYDLSQPASAAGTPTRSNTLINAPTSIASNGPTGSAVRAVYAGHRRSASENTAMLRHLGRGVIEAKSATPSIPVHRPILLLPFCGNGTVATFLKTPEAEGGVDEAVWSTWFQQGLAALAWCEEKGILHNDIKPANFLLDDEYNLRLGDFGSAMRIDRCQPPRDGIGLGTVAYASPEIVDPSQDRAFSFPSDMFAFGVTMRQCMTGREPYEGLRTVELMYHVRKGNYWEWQARQLSNDMPLSPVTLRLQSALGDRIRRSESLREPGRRASARPTLARAPSSDVVLQKTDPVATEMPTPKRELSPRATTDRRPNREEWLHQMVDPEPENRPTALALLQLARLVYDR
ncbi:hypothetical protein NliqN6_5135 [Naganishia liquefaciens]|uniref:Protein kinase domain-containing protein n=1 Tax=Naganishia liquefaciens TaxID=104408 RepID=A0A8H3YGW6_9TREE|nr:hypothetical protein NliqN6_5135 [Naganishia liquefaciens]